ncbi:hypothetical protein PsYK624_125080 [Phanerochaete sordida]|uniref:F-box domain-containing protein n=1 Tax=Phanerochaete sordida TaxID=48140 RepID=A0A9P3GL91_9APHY|nr:hypothetical protein PsYK624_125080 [Phanerochaete sordida]
MFNRLLRYRKLKTGRAPQAVTIQVERASQNGGRTHPGTDNDSLSTSQPIQAVLRTIPQKVYLSNLPQELLDYVVDFLYDDFSTLRACSLVCQAWSSASSFHLFSKLRWPPCEHQWIAMKSKILLSSSRCKCHLHDPSDTLDNLYTLLNSSPRISRNVQSLGLKLGLYGNNVLASIERYNQMVATAHQLDGLLDLIPQVQSLEMSSLYFDTRSPRAPFKLKGHIEELVLGFSSQEIDCQYSLDFISSFLSIDFLSLGRDSDTLPVLLPTSSRLARSAALELFICTKTPIPKWLTAVFSQMDLEVLTNLYLTGDVLPHHDVHAQTQAVLHAALRRCTALRSITCDDATVRSVLACSGPCPTLRKLRFRGSRHAHVRLYAGHWNTAAELMQCPLASTVDSLDVVLTYDTVSVRVSQGDSCQAAMSEYLSSINWDRLNGSWSKLKALNIRLSLRLERIWEAGKAPRDAHTEAALQRWRREAERCQVFLEEGMRAHLLPDLHGDLHCDLRIFISLTAIR